MPATQANIEYWFRLLYECFHGSCYGSPGITGLSAWLANLWLWIIVVGYVLSVLALLVIIYSTVRIFELRKHEEEYYETLLLAPDTKTGSHPRWEHIQKLVEGESPSEWREAIIEADIMLEDLLTERGYDGAGVGEKLKAADPAHFKTLQDAWEAHKVRNQIAHQGSSFGLSEAITQRTVAHYEAVFREFRVI